MKATTWITGLIIALIIMVFIACVGPWYDTAFTREFLAIVKLVGLFAATLVSLIVVSRFKESGAQRSVWLRLGIGFIFMFLGQCMLYIENTFLGMQDVFPTFADPLFAIGCLFLVWAFFSFSLLSYRSGLPLGSPLAYWIPAWAVLVLFLTAGYPLLAPVVVAGGSFGKVFFNLFYPITDFVMLAPCAVMLRVSIKFRGGRLLMVWMPLTLGFVLILLGDLMFAYQTSLDMQWLDALLNFFFTTGYLIAAGGVLGQLKLLKSS